MARGNLLSLLNREDDNRDEVNSGNPFGHSVTTKTAFEAWIELLKRTLNTGATVDTHWNSNNLSLFNASYTFKELGIPCKHSQLKSVESYVNHAVGVVDLDETDYEAEGASYDYAKFVKEQLPGVIVKLRDDLTTNSAVIQIASVERYNRNHSPCLTHIKFYFPNKNNLIVSFNFRSHDLYKAFLSNMAFLVWLGSKVAKEFPACDSVTYTGVSENLHLYEADYDCTRDELTKGDITYYQFPYVLQEYPAVCCGYLGNYFDPFPIKSKYPQVTVDHNEYILRNH